MREAGELPTLPGPGVLCQTAVTTREDAPMPSAEEVLGAQCAIERSLVTPRVIPLASPCMWKLDIPQTSLPDSRLLSGHAHPFLWHQLMQKRRDPVRPAVSENKRTLGTMRLGGLS